jgi:hypothetical protein
MTGALSLTWSPLLPWPLIAGLGLLLAAALLLAAWRRARGTLLRALALGILLVTLANPSLIAEQREALEDVVLVVADDSQSQEIGERAAQRDAAIEELMGKLEALEGTETRLLRVGKGDLPGTGRGTELFADLRRALAKVPRGRLGGVVVISDGQVHDVPESFESLAIDAPLHLLLTGRPEQGDRRLVIEQAPSFGIVGRTLSLVLKVEDLIADKRPRLAKVRLRRGDGEDQEFHLPVGTPSEIEFELDRRGATVLEIEVEEGPQELTLVNNRAAVVVNGVRDRLRVLLVSGEPHAGERAWRNILKSDPSVDLVHFTILRPPEKQDGTPIRELSLIAFPTRELFEVKLNEFDLIVFDRYRRRGVLPSIYLDNIATFVEQGGALLEAVGPTFATPLSLYRTPLGRILPAEPTGAIFEEGFWPRITALGERHPVTGALPGSQGLDEGRPGWGRWFRHVDARPGGGDVVMNGLGERPLLILDRVGEGRVAQLLSDHMWLWSRGFEGGGPQAELLRRVAHWLMKEPDLEEEDLRAQVAEGRLEISRRSLGGALPPLSVTLPSGDTRELSLEEDTPGQAFAGMAAEETGLYRVSDGTRTALAVAGPPNPREFADPRASPEPLRPIVEASGGGIVTLTSQEPPRLRKVKPSRDRHGRDWIGIVRNQGYVVTGATQTPLLPALLVLLLVMAGAVTAWLREGR